MAFGIIAAMEEELQLLEDNLQDKKEQIVFGQKFFIGKLNNKDVILAKCGVGKVNAAIGTTLLIQLKPKYIINTGVAGALGDSVKIGDIIIASSLAYHDVDLTAFGYKFGQMSKMPERFIPDSGLVKAAELGAGKISNCQIKKEFVVSGDSFIHNPDQISFIRQHFTENCVVEMEACAIAQTCYVFNVPFIIVRSVSDIIGENNKNNHEKFLTLAAEKSANLIMAMLSHSSLTDAALA